MTRQTSALVPAGVLLGHQAAYSLVGHSHSGEVSHSHLPFLAVIAAAAALWAFVRWLRERVTLGWESLIRLAAAQATAFVALEFVERLTVGGFAAMVTEPVVLAGVLAQVVVAGGVVSLVGIVQMAVAAFSVGPASPVVATVADLREARALIEFMDRSANSVRAPPVLLTV